MADATTTDSGCGCCRPEPKTAADVVRELEARREELDRRLSRLELAGAAR
jgi:hypothetical protein